MSESKRFEEWEQVDCNECARYWDSSCDGVKGDVNSANSEKPSTGSTRLCNSFLPTRSVVIPAKIKSLEKRVDKLTVGNVFMAVALILHLIGHLVGWL